MAERICKLLGVTQELYTASQYSNGEARITNVPNVYGENCVIIQSIGRSSKGSINDMFMELLMLITALVQNGARSITLVIPYLGYARQDHTDAERDPYGIGMVIKMLNTLTVRNGKNVDIILMELHSQTSASHFEHPTRQLSFNPYLIKYIQGITKEKNLKAENIVILAPDKGAVRRANEISSVLGMDSGYVDKVRDTSGKIDSVTLHCRTDLKGKTVFMLDDMIDTAGTACTVVRLLLETVPKIGPVYFAACHGELNGPALERLSKSKFEQVLVSDTLDTLFDSSDSSNPSDKIRVITVSDIIAKALQRQFGMDLETNSVLDLVNFQPPLKFV